MHIYKLDNQVIKELFILKGNHFDKQMQKDILDLKRVEFISVCKTNDDWAIEYLTPDRESISGDIFKEVDLPDGHMMFYIWNNRLDIFPDLKKELLRIIGETRHFDSWED